MKKRKRERGRPSLLSGQLQHKIAGLLADGASIKSACLICDIGLRTFYDWHDRGRTGEQPFASFFSACSRARERHKANLILRIVTAAKADWKAAAFLLERQFPSEFGRTQPREKIIIERPPPVPPPEPQTTPRRTEKWFTPKSTGIPFDKKALDYLATLRRAESQPPENGSVTI